MLFEEITHKVIGCRMSVHSELASVFQELIYQQALAIELEKAVFHSKERRK
ncbi:MAG TPA: GxxExxY protein [Bacteroidia bacterium]|nr:GxxExxY protein [Bacteroidia bacterium]